MKEYASRLNEVSKSPLLKPETFKARVELAKSLYGNDVNPSKHLNNLSGQDLRFDAERTASFGSGKNVSFKDYITEKMKYFPKHMDLSEVTEDEVKTVTNLLNNRPRKCLNYNTPNELIDEYLLNCCT